APELVVRRLRERRGLLEVGEVGLDHQGPAAGRLHLLGDLGELGGVAGGDDDVGPGLGKGDRRGSADPSSGTGDDGNLAVDLEAVKNHGRTVTCSIFLRNPCNAKARPGGRALDGSSAQAWRPPTRFSRRDTRIDTAPATTRARPASSRTRRGPPVFGMCRPVGGLTGPSGRTVLF